jgi:hypothetical protein
VQQYVAIGVAGETLVVRQFNAADAERNAGLKFV